MIYKCFSCTIIGTKIAVIVGPAILDSVILFLLHININHGVCWSLFKKPPLLDTPDHSTGLPQQSVLYDVTGRPLPGEPPLFDPNVPRPPIGYDMSHAPPPQPHFDNPHPGLSLVDAHGQPLPPPQPPANYEAAPPLLTSQATPPVMVDPTQQPITTQDQPMPPPLSPQVRDD